MIRCHKSNFLSVGLAVIGVALTLAAAGFKHYKDKSKKELEELEKATEDHFKRVQELAKQIRDFEAHQRGE